MGVSDCMHVQVSEMVCRVFLYCNLEEPCTFVQFEARLLNTFHVRETGHRRHQGREVGNLFTAPACVRRVPAVSGAV